MIANKYLLPLFTLLALFGSYAFARAAGVWSVSGKDSIDVTHMSSGAEIRGWMTLEQISAGFDIPIAELYPLLGIPADIPPATALKDMEGLLPDFEVSVVREKVDASLGIESSGEDTSMPVPVETAVVIPTATATPPTPSPTALVHVPQAQGEGDGSGAGPTPLPPGAILPGSEIKGRHTLNDISEQCQVDVIELLAALGLPEDFDLSIAAKDLIGMGNISEIQTIRDAVTALQK
jgi:hypothetical protein